MRDPRYKALLIGCGTFDRDPHKLAALKGPANDVRVMREALTHERCGLFETSNVKHLLDSNKDEMLEAIETFFNDAGIEDHLFFYYSGHGYPDTNNNLYLCARNTRTNLLGSSAVPDREINSMAENSRARKFIFVLDCCHSGGFKGGTAGLTLAHGSGRCLITSCASDQLSADAGTPDGASTFTHHLAEALTCGQVDSDGDGIVLTSEVFKFVQPRVYEATKQTVQWTMDKTFGEAALACTTPRARAQDGGTSGEREPGPTPPPPAGRAMLELSETRIEFRDVQPGEALPVERIDVFNSGDATLDWQHECEEPWITIERKGESLFIKLDTTAPGLRRGNIFVRDRGRGGSRTVRVLLQVAEPQVPKLVASPCAIDFGTQPSDAVPGREVRVVNAGPGRLNWEVESSPAQVVITRGEQGFTAEVSPGFLGTLQGVVRIKSNGGTVEIPITGTITPPVPVYRKEERQPEPPPPPPTEPLVQALVGWWTNDSGAFHIKLEGGAVIYTDHNLLGVKVGQGAMQVRGGVAFMQGTNSFIGNYTGQLSIQGVMLTGQIQNAMGQVFPVMFMRQQPWFAGFVS